MGSSEQERRAVTVPDSTWRKAKVLAAVFGLPVSDIVTRAIDEMASRLASNVADELMGEEVKKH
jgi:hypothetical protein